MFCKIFKPMNEFTVTKENKIENLNLNDKNNKTDEIGIYYSILDSVNNIIKDFEFDPETPNSK